jgi:hypothetical protein
MLSGATGKKTFQHTPIEGLAVSAGMLDEVLMSMSSEPLLFGVLSPVIADWLGAFPRIRLLQFSERVQSSAEKLFKNGLSVVVQFALYVPRLVIYFLRRWITQKVDNRMLTLLSSAGFGVPAIEFEGARIHVVPFPLNLPFIATHPWDVSQNAAKAQFVTAPTASSQPDSARYAFMWDDRALAQQCAESQLWKRLQPRLPDIQRRYSDGVNDSPEKVKDRLARVALTLEERLKEAIGAVELAHSRYYSDPVMLDAVRDFIVLGKTPP